MSIGNLMQSAVDLGYDGTYNDALHQCLTDVGYEGTLNDQLLQLMNSEGYPGTIGDQLSQYSSRGYTTLPIRAILKSTDVAAYYSYQNYNNIWQESGRRNPVTAVGQNVGCIDDTNQNNSTILRMQTEGATGDYISTSDSSILDITGDIEMVAYAIANDWSSGLSQTIVGKWNTSGNQRAYRLIIGTGGTLVAEFSVDGSYNVADSVQSTVNIPVDNYTGIWLRATWDASTSTVTFYTSTNTPETPLSSVEWTQLGATGSTTTTSIYSSTAPLQIGAQNLGVNQPFLGEILRAVIKDGINGTVAADFNPTDYTPGTDTNSFTSSSTEGETWTLNGNVRISPAGLHAIQSSSGNRGIYARHPTTGIRNLVANSGSVANSEDMTVNTTLFRIFVDSDEITGPYGRGVDKVRDNTDDNTHVLALDNFVFENGKQYCFGVIAKADEISVLELSLHQSAFGTNNTAYFNIADGTVGTVDSGLDGAGIINLESVYGSSFAGWYFPYIYGTAISDQTRPCYIALCLDDETRSYAGNGTDGIYITGKTLVEGSEPGAYQWVASQYDVTEQNVSNAYYISLNGTNMYFEVPRSNGLITFMHNGEGSTFFSAVSIDQDDNGQNPQLVCSQNSLSEIGFSVFFADSGGNDARPFFDVVNGTGTIVINAAGPNSSAERYTAQIWRASYKTQTGNDGFLYLDSDEVSSTVENSSPSTANATNLLQIGRRPNGTFYLDGKIYEFGIVNKELTNAEASNVDNYLSKLSGAQIS